jgi:tryptophan-rich sensory protein
MVLDSAGYDNSMADGNDRRSILTLLGFLAATYAVAWLSTLFTIHAIPGWYAALAKPSFNPPNAVFGPVWSGLYTLMAVAAWLVWRQPKAAGRSAALGWYWRQLLFNFLWTFAFFGQHRIGFALVDIAVLWLLILAATVTFFRVRILAGWMFVPYLLWVSFASVLNFAIWRLNG